MNSLINICERLKAISDSKSNEYFIPETWNSWGFKEFTRDPSRVGEIIVNPFEFYTECIEKEILALAGAAPNVADRDISELTRFTIYSMLIRTATTWDHYEKDTLCPGTFLKAICLLPYLRDLGIETIYLLPVFSCSDRYKKGEAKSPYSIKNIQKIERDLHDPLLGNYSDDLLDTEFKAFVEACHILGMTVIVDFVFRTVSRDSDLIVDHPDWFYWIKLEYAASISPPMVGRTKKPKHINDRIISSLYCSKESRNYLKKFVPSPDRIDEIKWKKLKGRHLCTGENILDLIEEQYGVTTLPGFSDIINDNQPLWTDVTYLKYYFDVNEKVEGYIVPDQPPYIMQDGVCLRLYPGRTGNTKLMEYISGVIPYHQNKYGIDGARLDMGHALTLELNKEIISRATLTNKRFLLWSEEFDPLKSGEARDMGFHFINGTIYSVYNDIEKLSFNKTLLEEQLMKSQLPIIAAIETPDTPRVAWAYKDRRRLEQLILLNCFLPNTIQFINNGLDLLEKQPMNLGLNNTERGRFVLDTEDPMYGKLAFFDHYRLHWPNEGGYWIRELLIKAAELRRKYIDVIGAKENYVESKRFNKNSKLTLLLYTEKTSGKTVFLLANRCLVRPVRLKTSKIISDRSQCIEIVFSTVCDTRRGYIRSYNIFMAPGEVIIGEISK